MFLFYSPYIGEGDCVLSNEESRHAVRVLRMKNGDTIHLTDGKGILCEALIISADPQGARVKLIKKKENTIQRKFHLHLAVALTENFSRYEWFAEKATETGVEEITPLVCERSISHIFRPGRLRKVMISAMKQSLQTRLPVLHEKRTLQEFMEKAGDGSKFIATCSEKARILSQCTMDNQKVILLIGPEGDFTEGELSAAMRSGFIPVSLGRNRLRTETAALAACVILNLSNT